MEEVYEKKAADTKPRFTGIIQSSVCAKKNAKKQTKLPSYIETIPQPWRRDLHHNSPKCRQDRECVEWAGLENFIPTQREIVQYPERRDEYGS